MYWPAGTPRIYASSTHKPTSFASDGLPEVEGQDSLGPPTPVTPATPTTPRTPVVSPVELDHEDVSSPAAGPRVRLGQPILALRASRSGHMFVVITATTMTVWQMKPTVMLALVVRSESSLESYGSNVDLLIRPDSAILVVQTSLGYLVTYSLATDAESRVYKTRFPNATNVQRRRQNHGGGPGHDAPESVFWGPGEGGGVRDVSVRFRMVIKVDAGIQSALALDDELVVATRKPAAVQCIRWTPDVSGAQTKTELVSRMGWLARRNGKPPTLIEMTHDRPMNLSTWVTSDGRACAVQRVPPHEAVATEADARRLFGGHCFHSPQREEEYAVRCAVNARFSLVAVGCADASVHVYGVKDYAGNIPQLHAHRPSASGRLTALVYSPDGYCLFAGFEHGWAMWSVFGRPLSSSLQADQARTGGEVWLGGVRDAAWVGGGCEVLLAGPHHDAVWVLEMARSAAATCLGSANLARAALQTTSSVMIYRGHDLPDLSSISADPALWHAARVPSAYLQHQWPLRCTAVSPCGRYVAVAGRRGLAHYSVASGRWRVFASPVAENEFAVRGGMCWHQAILVAAVEAGPRRDACELRLYARDAPLEAGTVLHAHPLPAPVVLVTPSGDDSLLVYTHDNLLYHFVLAPLSGAVRLVQVGHVALHGIVRSPARVRALSWMLPDTQLDGDPSQDVTHASVLFLVDGELVLLQPSPDEDGHTSYDMRVVASNVEYYVSMRDRPTTCTSLRNSLWLFEGGELRVWPDLDPVLRQAEAPPTIPVPLDFYPLSVLLGKAVVLGMEADLIQRRHVGFSFFHFSIRTHLFLPDLLRADLSADRPADALRLAREYQDLAYFPHALEMLLHRVLDDEVDRTEGAAVLPRVLALLAPFPAYLDVVVACTRKTEVRSWRTLYAYLPPPQDLFEEALETGRLKTAGGYLLVLHGLDDDSGAGGAVEQSARLLARAAAEHDWDLCKELARFLAALDDSGATLRQALAMARARGAAVGALEGTAASGHEVSNGDAAVGLGVSQEEVG